MQKRQGKTSQTPTRQEKKPQTPKRQVKTSRYAVVIPVDSPLDLFYRKEVHDFYNGRLVGLGTFFRDILADRHQYLTTGESNGLYLPVKLQLHMSRGSQTSLPQEVLLPIRQETPSSKGPSRQELLPIQQEESVVPSLSLTGSPDSDGLAAINALGIDAPDDDE